MKKEHVQIPPPVVRVENGYIKITTLEGQYGFRVCVYLNDDPVTRIFDFVPACPTGSCSTTEISKMEWDEERVDGQEYKIVVFAFDESGKLFSKPTTATWTAPGQKISLPPPPKDEPVPLPNPRAGTTPVPASLPPTPPAPPAPAPTKPEDPGAKNAMVFQEELKKLEGLIRSVSGGSAPTKNEVQGLYSFARELDKAIKANVTSLRSSKKQSPSIDECNKEITCLMIRIDGLSKLIPPDPVPATMPPSPKPSTPPVPLPAPAPAPAPATLPPVPPVPVPAPKPPTPPVPPVPAPAPVPAPTPVHIVTIGSGDGENNNFRLALVLGIIALIAVILFAFFYVSRNQTMDADRTDAAGTKARAEAEIERTRRLQMEIIDKYNAHQQELEGMRRQMQKAPEPVAPTTHAQPTVSATNIVEHVIRQRHVVVVEQPEPEIVVVRTSPIQPERREHVSAYETEFYSPTPMMDEYGYNKPNWFRYPPSRWQ